MELKLVKPKRLRNYGKTVISNGKKTLYLQEGIHTTMDPILDHSEIKTIKTN